MDKISAVLCMNTGTSFRDICLEGKFHGTLLYVPMTHMSIPPLVTEAIDEAFVCCGKLNSVRLCHHQVKKMCSAF